MGRNAQPCLARQAFDLVTRYGYQAPADRPAGARAAGGEAIPKRGN
jgi:hypothetical protein